MVEEISSFKYKGKSNKQIPKSSPKHQGQLMNPELTILLVLSISFDN
jgi:hypothetical protein